ncbi:hypothetical protein EUX98_g9678 [Antrodiella citrinella]|uniref:Uncharacterized protein n=1 Tax=Antrodiella citrinella TaxID=2447956 RepID=A0A4S4LP64_9APHY|nr:hypothetical protein EUX98_g9678 [Antrodiella citrinella]
MPSAQRAAIFAAALTNVVQWLDYKTFGRASWYDRAVLLLREASDVAPSLDDLKLSEARNIVRAALKEKVLSAHPPNTFFEELAMPATPVGAEIFVSELDELDTVSGKDYAAQAAQVEEKWAEADALWRLKAAPKTAAKAPTRPRPTPTTAVSAASRSPKVPTKRKEAPPSSSGEDASPPPVRSGTQVVVPSSLFALTPGRLIVGKTLPARKASKKPADQPDRAVWSVDAEGDDDALADEDYVSDAKSTKKDVGRAAKRPRVARVEKESFPDEDPDSALSDWFVYRELRKCVKCAASRAQGGVFCKLYRGETSCRRCKRTAQGCYWEISPGAIPVSYSGGHKQTRDATPASALVDSKPVLPSASNLFVSHSDAARPVFRVDNIAFVEEFPSSLASIRRRAALARVHPASHPASRAIAEVVEQSLANAQVQMTTGLLLARSLIRDRTPGFRGSGEDPEELEDPIDEDQPEDFTEDVDHPVLFRLEATPLAMANDLVPDSPAASVGSPSVAAVESSVRASSRHTPEAVSKSGSPRTVAYVVDEDAVESDSDGKGSDGGDADGAAVSGEGAVEADV